MLIVELCQCRLVDRSFCPKNAWYALVVRQMSYRLGLYGFLALALFGFAFYASYSGVLEKRELVYVSPSDFPVPGLASIATGASPVNAPAGVVMGASTHTISDQPSPEPKKIQVASVTQALPQRIVEMQQPRSFLTPLAVTAGEQPANSLALSSAGGVPFTNFTLAAGESDVTVNTITIQSAGLANVAVFDSVDASTDGGDDLGEVHFDSNHQAKFMEPFVIPAHSSRTISISANMIEDVSPYEGEMPQIAVVAIDASVPATGPLPIIGAVQSINSTLTIGGATAQRGENDPGADISRYIGDTNVKFAGIRITANSQEDLTLDSITWRQNGTAAPTDVANVQTIVAGIAYPAEIDGREFTSNFSPAIVIPKGNTLDLYIKGDITNTGALRTLKFDIDGSGDVSLTGKTYGYGVGLAADSNTDVSGNSVFLTSDGTPEGNEGQPFYSAPLVTINGGTAVTIQNAN